MQNADIFGKATSASLKWLLEHLRQRPRHSTGARCKSCVRVSAAVAVAMALGYLGSEVSSATPAPASPQLVTPGVRQVTVKVPGWRYEDVLVGTGSTTCLTGRGSVKLLSVRAAAGSLKFRRYGFVPVATLPKRTMIGTAIGTFTANGISTGPRVLSLSCAVTQGYELVLEIHATKRTTSATGVLIRYSRPDGSVGQLTIPFTIVMCARDGDARCTGMPGLSSSGRS